MQASPIAIGPIKLDNFEVPGSVQFGGDYKLAIHRLASGKRVVEKLGPSENEIKFSGIFTGPDADQRFRRLNNLRVSGGTIWLSWQTFRYKVIIKSLAAEYDSNWWIRYSIRLVVVDEPFSQFQDFLSVVSLVTSDLGAALTLLPNSLVDLGPLEAGLGLSNALVPSSSDNLMALSAARTSLASVKSLIDGKSSDLMNGPSFGLAPSLSAESFLGSVASAGSLAQAQVASSYLGRIANSLENLGT